MRTIIYMDAGFEIVGEGRNGAEAVELMEQLMPDLVLMDINMPEMDGLEATKQIKERYPYAKIIIVTVSDEFSDLFEAIKKGAQGYLLKNISPSAWLQYLRAVAVDEVPMSRKFALRLLQEFSRKKFDKRVTQLTAREQDILECVTSGMSNREIAVKLTITENTVKNHLRNIMQKLHIENRVQLARYAYEQGWVSH
ncbi:two component transcriptional regulator, LuxR family [Paenibacillus sp. UNCCL117]|nr:DNA-binding response regulator, NarL/FixJ family, contains REC and HTH domains [Paenibacillus sp. cl123]SFW65506.1 two component transcriptional regulator, LuxR family [Paenibacillus sp. UNCCL117]